MESSYNGWPASPDPDKINVERFLVPIQSKKPVVLTMRREVAPVLLNVARDVHREVAFIHRVKDDWGYAYRKVRGGNLLSCHASGTAIDLNASIWPMGLRRMSSEQREACARIVKRYKGVVTWGGIWSTRPDEHHWEISRGSSMRDVRVVIRELRLTVKGRP